MKQKNLDIRIKAKQEGIFLWSIADSLKMTDTNFSRMLRKELSPETKKRILIIIEELRESELTEQAACV